MKKILTITILLLSFLLQAQMPTTGLLGYYPFNGNANDASGNNQHGTVTGATLTTDRFGNANSAYSFNGTSNYITLPAGTFTTLNLYTYSCWIKASVANNGFAMCFGESSYGYCQALLTQPGGSITASSYNSGGSPLQSLIHSSTTYSLNTWLHLVMTRDLTSIKLYVNGVLFSSSSQGTGGQNATYGTALPIRALIGVRSLFNSGTYFGGIIDDVRIYSTVLSQSQITALYNESCFQNMTTTTYTICSGNSASISATPSPSNTINWYSSLSSTTSISTNSLLSTPILSAGQFTYFAEASTCTLTSQRLPITVFVNPSPTISASNGTICSGNSFNINPSGATSYTYSNGNPVSPNVTSTYSVIGSNSNGCLSNTESVTVTVNTTPTVSVNSGFVCSGQSFTLSPSGASSYSYSGGSAIVSPSANTTYTVYGDNGNGCYGTAFANIGVVASPTLSVSNPGNVCIGNSVNLSVSGANYYTWSTGSSSANISVSPTVTTQYTVSGVNLFGCLSTTVTNVNVNTLPIVSVNSGTVCSGNSFTILPTGASTYTYSGGSNIVSPTINSTYSVVGTSAQGCLSSNVAVSSVSVLSLPSISVNSGSVCAGNSFTLIPSGGISYTYSGGSSIVSPSSNTFYTVTGSGSNGCINNALSSITVISLPAITISGPSSICFGDNAVLSASGASSYTWNTGSNASSISIAPGTTTTYTVIGNNSNGCGSLITKLVTVNALPIISVNSGSICSGFSFTMIPSGASTYTYSSGTNIVSPSSNSTYSVTGTSAQGCVSSNVAISTVSVSASPVVSVNSGSICSGNSFTMLPSGALTYSYSSSTAIVAPLVNTNYTVTGYNALGCSSQAISTVSVNALPVVSISSPSSICSGNSAILIANGANSYSWNTGALTQSISVSPLSSTNYTLIGLATNGCSANATSYLTVNSLPIISVNSGSVCSGNSFTLIASGASTYTYSSGSNIVSPSANSSYSVSGTSAQGCISSNIAIANVSVVAIPVISVNSGTVCSGTVFTLSPSGASSYSYSSGTSTVNPLITTNYTVLGFNAQGCVSSPVVSTVSTVALPIVSVNSGSICAGSVFTIIPSGATSYTISGGSAIVSPVSTSTYVVVGSNVAGCISSPVTSTVLVNALPTISVNNASICLGSTYTIVPSGASTYTFSGGSSIVSPSVYTSYSISGTSSAGCVSSVPAICNILIYSLPAISVSGSPTVCSGSSVTFTSSGASTYTWNTGYIGSIVSLTPSSNTNYTVIGTDANGCMGTTTKSLTVIAGPTIAASNGTICIGNSFVMNPFGATSYSYSSASATVSPSTTTNYFITGYNSAGCASSNIATVTVMVNPLPIINISGQSSVCSGSTTTLTASGASSFTWTNFSTGSTIAITPSVNGAYTVTGTDANGCSDTASFQISVNSLPILTVNSGAICPGNSFTLNPSGALSYTYSSGSNIVSPSTTSTYSIYGSNAAGCVNSLAAVATVSVMTSLSVTVSGNTSICAGDTAYLTANGASNYIWDSGPLTNTIALNPSTTTTYSVTGVSGTCSNTAVFVITVSPVPVLSISNGTICSGSSFTLSPSGAITYTYSSGSAIVNPLVTSSYSIIGENSSGCFSQIMATVHVNQLPVINIISSAPVSMCVGEEAILVASGALTYTWNTVLSDTSNPLNVAPLVNTSYTVFGTDQNGCVGSSVFQQVVDECTGIAKFNIQTSFNIFPNPNTGSFSIHYDLNTTEVLDLKIENLEGKVIKSFILSGYEKSFEVKESELKPGIYFCKLVSKGKSLGVKKMIVTN